MKMYDAFISYASEDKDFASRLAKKLQSLGLSIWFAEFCLQVGDGSRQEIEQGLSSSRFGIVILSRHFSQKQWPQIELSALFARETNGENVILPIWKDITKGQVAQYFPLLVDKYALKAHTGVNTVANSLLKRIKQYSKNTENLNNVDPARSCIKKMDKEKFENLVDDILQKRGFISSEKDNLSRLYNNKSLPDGYIVKGLVHHSITYMYQFTTEFGFSDDVNNEVREEGNPRRILGKSVVVILSNNIKLPQFNKVKELISNCIEEDLDNLVLFINKDLGDFARVHGIFNHALRETQKVKKLESHILLLGEITYLLLTSDLHHKYSKDIQFKYKQDLLN